MSTLVGVIAVCALAVCFCTFIEAVIDGAMPPRRRDITALVGTASFAVVVIDSDWITGLILVAFMAVMTGLSLGAAHMFHLIQHMLYIRSIR